MEVVMGHTLSPVHLTQYMSPANSVSSYLEHLKLNFFFLFVETGYLGCPGWSQDPGLK